jgi:transcription initiation factor IIF auxiliary subunit
MTRPPFALELCDSVFDPDSPKDRVIQVRNADSERPLYKVFLFLRGPELPFVERVEYILHPTFKQPHRTIVRSPSNPHCKLVTWAWGIFELQGVVHDKRGTIQRLVHFLQYDRELQDPQARFERLPQ